MEEKKKYIIENVGRLYFKKGIRAVTMDDVAAEFGISKKTLYQYFSDKKGLVTQVIEFFIEESNKTFKQLDDKNAVDSILLIRKHVAFIYKFYNNGIDKDLKKYYPELYKKINEIKRERIFTSTIDNLKLGMTQGMYRTDLDPYLIAKLQVGRMLFTMNPDYGIFEEYEVNSLAFFDSMMDYHMNAICNEKGIKYYKNQLNKVQYEETN
ncbi:TetR/AcrR family transcriptional regulator [Draconibacterium halophilum]|uniref:TetR/AcrR family transcriptional regulator n=1 Tax=Draconibacterium halophilum TaxID=2706887 RepID=A0A6C0RBW3_9BACT|nr:TetR/AcrR family transcriptional regulator [Draconibacterium halophilum]QIA06671.1 TetR/AcrR family transcriptional regulator [Draconibacterium halophilum]